MNSHSSFHILSFEGPDPYSRAGGIASRITGLARALAGRGIPTHLWFVGDPDGPGHETDGLFSLHRWCQWISRYHGAGVYDGEDGKVSDYARSVPPYLFERELRPAIERGQKPVVLAEEWHTVPCVLHLDYLLRQAGLRDRVQILWNANNTFGFERIDWPALARAAVITTVSRYMKHCMRPLGVDALVIPNGLSEDAFVPPDRAAVSAIRRKFAGRPVLTKMARFDPDKRWLLAMKTVAELKKSGQRPLFIARGGVEAYGEQVLQSARDLGMHIVDCTLAAGGGAGLAMALQGLDERASVVVLRSHVDPDARRTLFRAADAVLANSAHEPFGLVSLEAMAAGGLSCTGCSGEDYAVAGHNGLVLETNDPEEFVTLFRQLRQRPSRERAVRRAGRRTALQYGWSEIVERGILPRVELLGGDSVPSPSERPDVRPASRRSTSIRRTAA